MLKAIDTRVHNQFALEAGLHGVKVPFKYNHEKLTEQEQLDDIQFDPSIAEKAMLEAQRRVKARYV